MRCDVRCTMYDVRFDICTMRASALGVLLVLTGCEGKNATAPVVELMREKTPVAAPAVAEPRPSEAMVWEMCEAAFVPVQTSATTRARITGTLPRGLQDDTSWADVVAHYEPLHGEVYGGTQALRVTVQKINRGTCGVASEIFPLTNAQWLAVRLAARSGSGSPVTVGLRQRGSPYAYLWKKTISVRPE